MAELSPVIGVSENPEFFREVSPKESQLATKMARIMGEIDKVPKRGWNDYHKYEYVLEAEGGKDE